MCVKIEGCTTVCFQMVDSIPHRSNTELAFNVITGQIMLTKGKKYETENL